MEEFLVTTQPETTDSNSLDGTELAPKGRHHFTIEEDMAMLREVAARNPYGVRGNRGAVWSQVESTLQGMDFDCTMKSCQDRLARLLRTFESDELRSKSICGQTMNANREMAELLEQITQMRAQGIRDGTSLPPGVKKDDNVTSPRSSRKILPNGLPNGGGGAQGKRGHDDSPHGRGWKFARGDEAESLRLKKQEVALKREKIELMRKDLERREKRENERNELERQKLALDKDKLEMERKKLDIEIAERTQQLESNRQQQQVLFQLLSKNLTQKE